MSVDSFLPAPVRGTPGVLSVAATKPSFFCSFLDAVELTSLPPHPKDTRTLKSTLSLGTEMHLTGSSLKVLSLNKYNLPLMFPA